MAKSSQRHCPNCEGTIPDNKSRCPICGSWEWSALEVEQDSILLSEVPRKANPRICTGPWDYVFGGGLVNTGCYLLGGAPGAGKTTMLLQLSDRIQGDVIFVAAEQSTTEIALYADRLRIKKDIRLVPALNGANVARVLERWKPSLVIIDSLQGLVGDDDGLQEQVCTIAKNHAVKLESPIIMISHVTKDEVLAGRMTLQHKVDATLIFYTDEDEDERVLLATKNRFGPAFVESRFRMTEDGLNWTRNTKFGSDV
jgi:DNA repair protein RadA/Sms